MKIKGTLVGVSRDWKTGKFHITFEMDEGNISELDRIKDKLLQITVDRFTNHRSGRANRLMWECIGQVASYEKKSKWDKYLEYIKLGGKFTYIVAKPNAVEAIKQQWREVEEVGPIEINGQQAVQLICYFGSSTYNSQEFSKLLESIIQDMEDLGLPRPTSQDMQRAIKEVEEREKNENIKPI